MAIGCGYDKNNNNDASFLIILLSLKFGKALICSLEFNYDGVNLLMPISAVLEEWLRSSLFHRNA